MTLFSQGCMHTSLICLTSRTLTWKKLFEPLDICYASNQTEIHSYDRVQNNFISDQTRLWEAFYFFSDVSTQQSPNSPFHQHPGITRLTLPFFCSASSYMPIKPSGHSQEEEGGLWDSSPPPSQNTSIVNKPTFFPPTLSLNHGLMSSKQANLNSVTILTTYTTIV